MSDLLARLRMGAQAYGFHLRQEAADEIERLRGAYAKTRMRQAELETTEAELLEALERIAGLSAGGPHVSGKDGMNAALASLDRARDIAKDALSRARTETPEPEGDG